MSRGNGHSWSAHSMENAFPNGWKSVRGKRWVETGHDWMPIYSWLVLFGQNFLQVFDRYKIKLRKPRMNHDYAISPHTTAIREALVIMWTVHYPGADCLTIHEWCWSDVTHASVLEYACGFREPGGRQIFSPPDVTVIIVIIVGVDCLETATK